MKISSQNQGKASTEDELLLFTYLLDFNRILYFCSVNIQKIFILQQYTWKKKKQTLLGNKF